MDDCANAQYPPITAAIRSRVESGWDPWPEAREWLLGKCDTIDAIHARLEAAYDRLRAERDSMAAALDRAEGEHDYAPESHYMMLPKDADGEPVHIGDVMEWPTTGETFEVVGIGDGVLFYTYDDDYAEWTGASTKRHHHAPTVEDVLREFAAEFNRDDSELCDEEIIERFAAKLRLAGDAE